MSRDRPDGVSSWAWYDPRPANRELWHQCLIESKDPALAAMEYERRGGVALTYQEIAKRKRAAAKIRREAAKAIRDEVNHGR